MTLKIEPSKQIWDYFKGDITSLGVACFVADLMGGYYISYSATELLKDLGLVSSKTGRPNKRGLELVSKYLHEKFHRGIERIEVKNPYIE